jgi:tRNA 2-selenouridine synthase
MVQIKERRRDTPGIGVPRKDPDRGTISHIHTREITDPSPAALAELDAIIDVRSPSEYAVDHIPGAINLPVLSDEERAQVGTIYVQDSRFLARKIGAALISRNIARHLEGALADKPSTFRPLVYCWRGGQRSGAMATVLSQIGWRTSVLKGGYKTYRRRVKARLYDEDLRLEVVLLDGQTGTGKTALLNLLARRGVQTVNLEELALHRGSAFGAMPGRPQPSQKMFESRLAAALDALDSKLPVVIEAEGGKVGARTIPPALWKAMTAGRRIIVSAPPAARARYLVTEYAHAELQGHALLDAAIGALTTLHSRETIAAWRALLCAEDLEALAADLIERHYDPAYDRIAARDSRPLLGALTLEGLEPADLATAARDVEALINSERSPP